jgi:hypothetical protein
MLFSIDDDITKLKEIMRFHLIEFLFFCDYKLSKIKLNNKK